MSRARTVADFGDGLVTADLPAGSVLQVVENRQTYSGQTSITSSGYVDVTGLTVSITPTSASSKIKLTFTYQCGVFNSGSGNAYGAIQLLRGATAIFFPAQPQNLYVEGAGSSNMQWRNYQTLVVLDSPNTTSEVTYKLQAKLSSGGSDQINFHYDGSPSSVLLEEIAG